MTHTTYMWTCANYIRNVVARLGIARGRVQLSVQSGAGGGLGGGQVVSPLQVNGKWKYNYTHILELHCTLQICLGSIQSGLQVHNWSGICDKIFRHRQKASHLSFSDCFDHEYILSTILLIST